MKINALILSGLVVFFGLTAGQVFSQEEAETFEESESSTQEWVLGDVTALDVEGNQLTLSYIDYDAYEDKEMTISVDAVTNYENADSLQSIEVGDIVSVGYVISPQGKATALNVCLEKFEGASE